MLALGATTGQSSPVARRVISIDPVGTAPEWMYVVIEDSTDVAYAQQYGGTACRQGEIEGYLVPVHSNEALSELRALFEVRLRGAGVWHRRLDGELLGVVRCAVGRIEYWPTNDGEPEILRVDDQRLDDLDEAWIPVVTSDGPGVLIWCNSD
jgi:Family of unknown function (DUF6210)